MISNAEYAVKTYGWMQETEVLLGSKKKLSFNEHLTNLGLTKTERKEAIKLWDIKQRGR